MTEEEKKDKVRVEIPQMGRFKHVMYYVPRKQAELMWKLYKANQKLTLMEAMVMAGNLLKMEEEK